MSLKTLWRRLEGPPAGAHGRRNIDGSYFAVWKCQRGHREVGEADGMGRERCHGCWDEAMEWKMAGRAGFIVPAPRWERCTPKEARDYLFELEGFGMYSGVGFKLMPEVREAA